MLLKSFTHRSFALLWTSQVISRLGDSVYQIALAWWVLKHTGSAAAMGTVLICSFSPMLALVLIGGVAVDRFSRVRLLLYSDLVRGLVVTVLSLLALTQALQLWHVYVVSITFGIADAFFQPAYSAVVPELVTSEVLPSANSLTNLSKQLVRIIGPGLGALIVAFGDIALAFGINALSFFISAACLLVLPATPARSPANEDSFSVSRLIQDFRDGLGVVVQSPWLWATITLSALGNLTQGGPVSVALPFLVSRQLHGDVGALGLVYSLFSLGSIMGAIWLGRRATSRRGLVAYGAWLLLGIMTLVQGFAGTTLVVALAAMVSGAALITFGLIWTHTVQELVPRQMLGRVSSIDEFGSFLLVPIGFAVAGWATDQFGAQLVFVAGGLATASLALLGLLHPAIRKLN